MSLSAAIDACAAYLTVGSTLPQDPLRRRQGLDATGVLSIVMGTGAAGPAPTSCDMQPQDGYTTTTPDAVGPAST